MTIVGLGDSITAGNPGFLSPIEDPPDGSGDIRSQYAYWMMQAHADWHVLNRGVSGERSDEILSRFDKDVLAHRPQLVIVLAGVNDLYQGHAADSVIENLKQIYGKAQKAGLQVIPCTIMPYAGMGPRIAERMREVNDWIRSYSTEENFCLCDLHTIMRDPNNPLELAHTDDGVHPDIEGYRLMADALTRALERSPRCLNPNS